MPRARKELKPRPMPKRIGTVLARLVAGETLCRQFRPRAIGDKDRVTLWYLEPSGRQIGPCTADDLMRLGYVQANAGGLFGSGDAQTFAYTGKAVNETLPAGFEPKAPKPREPEPPPADEGPTFFQL